MKLLLVLALLGTPSPAQAEHPQIDWRHCQLNAADAEGAALDEAGAECGELKVPLDYGRPDGRTASRSRSRCRG